jgi:hypothetical protein
MRVTKERIADVDIKQPFPVLPGANGMFRIMFFFTLAWICLSAEVAVAGGKMATGFYCSGGEDGSIRTQIVSITDEQLVSKSSKKPGARPSTDYDRIISKKENELVISGDGIEQTMTWHDDKSLTVKQGTSQLTLKPCDYLGDAVFMTKFKASSSKNFGTSECQPFDVTKSVFVYDPKAAHTTSLTDNYFGKGNQAVPICRIVPFSAAVASKAVGDALKTMGLPLETFDVKNGVFTTGVNSNRQSGLGIVLSYPFTERYSVTIVDQDDNNSQVTILRQVQVRPQSSSGYVQISSDGFKEHWLFTEIYKRARIKR